MEYTDLRLWHIYSWWLIPWFGLSKAFSFVPSPFPVAVAATVFAAPYHIQVLGDPFWYGILSAGLHLLCAVLSPVDLSVIPILAAAFTFGVYSITMNTLKIYGELIPNLHKNVHSVRERFVIMLGQRSKSEAR